MPEKTIDCFPEATFCDSWGWHTVTLRSSSGMKSSLGESAAAACSFARGSGLLRAAAVAARGLRVPLLPDAKRRSSRRRRRRRRRSRSRSRSRRSLPRGGCSLAQCPPRSRKSGAEQGRTGSRRAGRPVSQLRGICRAGRRRRTGGEAQRRRRAAGMGARQGAQRRAAARHVALLAVLLPVCCRAAPERLHYAVPEETGSGSLVGPLARDLGLSPADLPARQLRLVSAAKRQLKHFAVGAENGHLYVSERLDREEMCGDSASCSVSFEVVLQNPLNVFHVDVAIQDINDNSPVFSKAALDLEIGELMLPGARFPLEMAQDPDVGSNSLLSYQLTDSPSFSLAVKESPDGSRQPELVLEAALDREKQSSFQMVLTAVDGGSPARSGTVQIRINVTDANDNAPVFSKSAYEARVRENAPAGSLVLRVRATDADAGSNGRVSYAFSNVPEAVRAVFSIDSDSGDIRNEGTLDFEERNRYSFGVEARDGGGLSGHCKVLVEVTDENDNAPEITTLSVSSPVPEDSPPGTVVALVNVHDADSGDNGKVRCELEGESPFAIVASSGSSYKVVTASALDRERAAEHNVTVVASDGGSPALCSRTTLALAVSDVNDNAPVFEEAAYSAYVAENNAAGAAVLRVRARDADAGANGRVSYWLAGGSAGEAAAAPYVSVEARSGALYAQRSFDYEQCREFAVEVRAQDGGSPARSSTATVRVFVLDLNDNAPQVLWPAAAASPGAGPFEVVPRSAEAGYLVAKVVAVDADAGRNAWLSYELLQATEPALFRLGLHSGEVRTARAVSERDAARQRLVVVVKDHGQPALSATATLHVVLAESLQEALPALSERAAGAESPADLQFYLVLALALLCALFVLSVALAVAARVRRAGPPAVLRCLGAERFAAAGPAFPADFCEGTLPYSYNLCVAPGRAVAECALLPAPLPSRAVDDLLSGDPPAMLTPSSSRAPAEPPSHPDAVQQAQPNTDWRFSQTQRPGTSGSQNGEEGGAWPNNQFDTEMLQAMILASANEAADGNSTLGGGTGTMGLSARYGPQFTLQHVPDYRQNVYIPGSTATLSNSSGKRDTKNAGSSGGNKKKSGKKEKK
ncbi:protocadherin gamma-B5-like isoform X2 [Rhea pennata]|uniref:protocadherin gamma-B5-like isoform X2 n=1 Tax=Rhea pennata TaxID=8795 RepID=UPI002E25754F